ncbi:MAG: DUF1800 domain-containing protein [Sphingobacteriales bacterium]|jgi:uncharacterized protein (DUF1800 family)|nr:DUF1800 domain-containing protein [Sphingobacteriales bacterium]MBP9142353.1 DUF1800 domain-containing protein [Chitinophagales bacterium]MDA0198723.1 DUF1800 domain-containing protein [Bacteroidota bacterium]MBK6889056.1 DUF1800 domain-containing protein [Sphingobacteriales bacterium]MBK7528439.1 DUF1800 domain-containing protein [Sphingobacteriales bacterium]
MPIECIGGTLLPYIPSPDMPWDARRIAHLYRRAGFGATLSQIQTALNKTPSQLVDELIDAAIALPPTPPPVWYDWSRVPVDDYTDYDQESYDHMLEMVRTWLQGMLDNGLREKMMLFWHNHFVTGFWSYRCSAYLFSYYKTLQLHALGNFKNFTIAIGKCPAMLLYLNNNVNVDGGLNENYARELMELFTMGVDNGYDENDIWNVARAISGWTGATYDGCEYYANDDLRFDVSEWDSGTKTIFGQTGAWDYDDVHNLIFTQRADEVAQFICKKLYKHFVYVDPNQDIINQMVTTFKNNNFELAPVLRQLLKSEHFFDDKAVGTQIKSPIDMWVGLINSGQLTYDDMEDALNTLFYFAADNSQTLLEPPNVAGWKGHHTWLTQYSLSKRWENGGNTVWYTNDQGQTNLINLAKGLTNNSKNPAIITQALIDFFTPNGLPRQIEYDAATAVFKGEIPENYYTDGTWSLDYATAKTQIRQLLMYIVQMPEFNLA